MTINEARKILGILGNECSDDQIEADIRSAELLKNIFFNLQTRKENSSGS